MIVAELEIFHSRPIAPTRRIALGGRNLPVDPAPGAGGLLLAGVIAQCAPEVAGDLRSDVMRVAELVELKGRAPQPVARHRFQTDRVGLTLSPQRLVANDGVLEFDLDTENAAPVQLVLGALYAAAAFPPAIRSELFTALRSALVWNRPVDSTFISTVMDGRSHGVADLFAWNDPVGWALDILEIETEAKPARRAVMKQYRSLLRTAHPDHGGLSDDAANRISDLTKARDILLAP